MKHLKIAGLLAMGLLAACAAESTTSIETGSETPAAPHGEAPGSTEIGPFNELPPPVDYVATDGQRQSEGRVDLMPEPGAPSRQLRRMSVVQLGDAIRVVTGGLYWQDTRGNDELARLATTLGVPNYLDTTNEDLDASLVFQKFLGDGVRNVCTQAIDNDLDMAQSDRVMIRHVAPDVVWEQANDTQKAAIDRNLRYMKLRITGHAIAQNDEDSLSRLRWLYRSVTHATNSPEKGWRAVCVGLMSSPEFYMY